ncbi:MAG: PAS domain S-box protein, partial [Rhodoferax sp.]|nr:PAS domain S-box protein [Rhodoferax sp.]
MTLSSDTAGSQTGGPFSAQMLAPLFGAMPDGVAYCRMEYAAGLPQDCTVLYANAALYRLTGLSDVVGQRFSAVFPGGIDVREKPMSTYVQVVQTGQAARYERYLAALDKWFSVSVYSPNPDHFMLVFSDVSSQHAMEAQADRYAEWILDSVGEGLCRVDEGGVITFINPVGAQLLGYQPQEMLGQVAHTLFHHSYPDGSPYPLEACNGRAALAQNRPHSVDSEVFWRKDGSSFPVHYDSAPMRVDGRLRGTVLTFRDISAEVAIRRTLMDNQVKFRKAQEIAGFGSYVTDVESGHWEGSAQLDALLGLDADYPHSVANWTGLIDPEFRQPVLQHYADVLAGKLDFRMDYRIRRPLDGQHRWLAVNGELERDAQGKPLRLIGSVQDITERMQAKQELIALNASLESRVLERTRELVTALDTAELAKRSRGAFLANMSHEIRTPMNTVMGMVHLALKTQPAPPLRGFLEKIQQSGTHLLAMINDILDFSKIDAGKLQLENADFRVEEMLQHIIQLNEGKATEKGLSLRLDLEPAVPQFVRGDALRLSQILINFLNNAIKFTERGGIVLRVRNCEGAAAPQDQCLLRFEVQDTGIGLD